MLNRLFGRRPPAEEEAPAPAEQVKPGLRDRIKGFFVALWNWMILLFAIAAMLLFIRLAFVSWNSATTAADTGTIMIFGGLGVGSVAASGFLAWQVWRGARYLMHRRRSR